GLPVGDSIVIYNGIDLKRFNGAPQQSDDDRLKVLYVGRLVTEKGPHTAIEAISELARRGIRSVSLTVVGVPAYPWDYPEMLRKMVESCHLQEQVRFLEAVPNSNLPEIYRRHDALVFPSVGEEGFPMTLIEAMSCGLTVVGSVTGGT